MAPRYTADGLEAEFEPGSSGRVLRNKLQIRTVRDIGHVESVRLLKVLDKAVHKFSRRHRFTSADIRWIHRTWLSEVYAWAGDYRSVNISKGEFTFAVAREIPRLMQEFERGPLSDSTPCLFTKAVEIARAVAIVHAEFILIHPFREGNGRCARVLATLMGLQAGLPPMDFGGIRSAEKRRYFHAVERALSRNYDPMTDVFEKVIGRTLRASERSSS